MRAWFLSAFVLSAVALVPASASAAEYYYRYKPSVVGSSDNDETPTGTMTLSRFEDPWQMDLTFTYPGLMQGSYYRAAYTPPAPELAAVEVRVLSSNPARFAPYDDPWGPGADGISIDAFSGQIGVYDVWLEAVNAEGTVVATSNRITANVREAPTGTLPPELVLNVGDAFPSSPAATTLVPNDNGAAPYRYSIHEGPSWLTISENDGRLASNVPQPPATPRTAVRIYVQDTEGRRNELIWYVEVR